MDDHKFIINENISNYFGKDKCKEVMELCSQYDLDLFDLIDGFLSDLIDWSDSAGSDERNLVETYFNRRYGWGCF